MECLKHRVLAAGELGRYLSHADRLEPVLANREPVQQNFDLQRHCHNQVANSLPFDNAETESTLSIRDRVVENLLASFQDCITRNFRYRSQFKSFYSQQ